MQNFLKFLYRKQREVIDQLEGLVDGVDDIDATSLFQRLDDGFQDRGCNGNNVLITLVGPKEATGGMAHLHIKERYATAPPHDLIYYRYEICWKFDRVLSEPQEDYWREAMITLRRGVRFDYHPEEQDTHHPKYHWRPNGCSEFRLESKQMTPLKTALIAVMMFDRERLETLTNDSRITKALTDLHKEIAVLPK